MPIEIRELIIKATVNESTAKNGSSSSKAGETDRDMVVSECVEQVLDILKARAER